MSPTVPSYGSTRAGNSNAAAMRQAFLLAVALHLVATPGLFWVLAHGHADTLRPAPVILECDVVRLSQAPLPEPLQETRLAHVLACMPPAARDAAVLSPPAPGAPPVVFPVPSTLPVATTPPRLMAPDLAGEDVRSLAATDLHFPGEGHNGGPVAISEIRPLYPDAARTQGQQGSVTIHLRVTYCGGVDYAEVTRSSGFAELDQAALAAVRKTTFKPAEQYGQPIAAEMNLQFMFRLDDVDRLHQPAGREPHTSPR